MAKVIDRLRIQGHSPTRETSFSSRAALLKAPNPSPIKQNNPWIQNGDGFCMSCPKPNKDFLSSSASAASRKAEVLLRMRAANHGLSTMDSLGSSSRVQFMLRGRHVTKEPGMSRANTTLLPPERISPITKQPSLDDNQERQIKVHIGKAKSEPVRSISENSKENKAPSTKDDISLPTFKSARNDTSLPNFKSPCFMLGPTTPASLKEAYSPRRTLSSSSGAFELTGHRMKAGADTGLSRASFYDEAYPQIETPLRSSHRRRARNPFKDTSPASTDPRTLNQCLSVHQSMALPLGTPEEALKLKHFTQFVKKDGKVTFNNPYRKIKKKERRTLSKSDPQYQFDSVSSYIHFNRIYPQAMGDVPNHVPQLSGFPTHCTDTVLLRMMLEMNKIPRNSPDKYSDVAVQKELDEYLMVRTPSAFSKPASARSKKTAQNRSSRNGGNELAQDEEKVDCVWAGNDQSLTQRDSKAPEEDAGVQKISNGLDEDVNGHNIELENEKVDDDEGIGATGESELAEEDGHVDETKDESVEEDVHVDEVESHGNEIIERNETERGEEEDIVGKENEVQEDDQSKT